MHQFTVVLQDRKGGPYRIQRMAPPSPMDLLLNLLERKQAVVAVLDNRKLAPLARKRIKPLARVFFFEQLESPCPLGFDPARAMEIAQITTATKTTGLLPWMSSENPLKRIAGDMLKRLQQGQSLGEAASQYPNLFDKVAMGLVDAGEHSGSLAETFGSIRQLTGRDEKVRDKLISISVYPAIVLAIAAIVIYKLATGPLPQVGRVLESMKGGLPWQSQLIIATGQFIGAYPIVYVIFIASLLYILTCLPVLIRRTPVLHKWILKVPLIEKLALASIRANFVQTLATLKKAKVDNLKCLLLLQGISWCYPYRAALTRGYRRVASGEALAVALEEEVDILDRLALVMNRDLDNAIDRAETLAKPLIAIALAAIIGFIAAAVYGPLIELYNRI